MGDRGRLLRSRYKDILYGFFQHSKFTALAVPKALTDGFNGSHDVHMFVRARTVDAAGAPRGRMGS